MASLVLNGNTSGSVTISSPAVSGTTTLTLPATTDTLVGKTTTDTLTNKTLTSPAIAGTPTGVGVLTAGTAVASTSGTSIDFTSIPSWVKRITLMFNGVSTSGTAHLLIQAGTGGTPTTSGYNSVSVYGLSSASGTGGTSSTAGYIMFTANATYVNSGSLVITNVTGNTWVSDGIISNTVTTIYTATTSGNVSLAGALNMIRITTSNGTDTFDAGSVNILYE